MWEPWKTNNRRLAALSAKTSTLSNTLQSLVNPRRATMILKRGGGTHTLQSILEMTCSYELGVFRTYGEKRISHNSLFTAIEKAKASAVTVPSQQRTTRVFTWELSNSEENRPVVRGN